MNRNYKVIWNQSLNCFMAVAEYAKSRGKSSGSAVTSSATVTSGSVVASGVNILRWSAVCTGLIAAGFSMQATAACTIGNSIDCGSGALASGATSVALGHNAKANGAQGVAIGGVGTDDGQYTTASGDQSIAIGSNVVSSGSSSIAIGGDDLDLASRTNINGTLSLSSDVNTGGVNTIFNNISGRNLVDPTNRVTQYPNTASNGAASVAIGVQAVSTGALSTAFGTQTKSTGVASAAFGVSASATKDGSVALGAGASTLTDANDVKSAIINGVTYSNFAGSTDISAGDQVSIGSVGRERQIKNVAAGNITSNSTDAINGSQLFSIANKLTDDANTGKVGLVKQASNTAPITVGGTTGGTSVSFANSDKADRKLTGVAVGTNTNDAVNVGQLNTLANQTFKIQANNDTASAVKSSDTIKFIDGKNITITRAGNNITVGTADDLNANSVTTGASKLSNTGITITKGATSPVGITDITLTNAGLNNGGNKVINVASGTLSDNSTDAVNGSQLNATNTKVTTNTTNIAGLTNGTAGIVRQDAGTGAITVGAATAGTSVSFANSTGGNRVLSGVAAGSAPTDAANVSQLKASSVVAGKNTSVSVLTTGNNTAYTVNAEKSTVSTAIGSGLAVTSTKNATDVTDYAVELNAATKASLGKADSAIQTITSTSGNLVATKTGDSVSLDLSMNPNFTTVTTTGKVKAGDIVLNSATGQINGLTAGILADDAATVGQVTASNDKINQLGGNSASHLGGGATYNATTGAITAPSYQLDKGTVTATNVGGALTNLDGRISTNTDNIGINTGNIIKAKTTVTKGDNIEVTSSTNTDGSTNYQVATAKNLTVDSIKAGNSTLNSSGVIITDGTKTTTVNSAGTNVTDGINSSTYGANGLSITGGPSITATGINAGNKKITGVLAGEDATDAVNYEQLSATNANVATNTINIADNSKRSTGNLTALGGGAKYDVATDTYTAPTYALNDGTESFNTVGGALGNLDTRTTKNTGDIAANAGNIIKAKSTVSQGENILVTETKDSVTGASNYEVKTARALNLDSVTTGNSKLDTAGLTITGGPSITTTGINAGNKKITGVLAGEDATDAVNYEQLSATNTNVTNLTNGTAGIVRQAARTGAITVGGTTSGTSVSFANSAGANRVLSGVGAGVADNDAVNFSQLKAVTDKIDNSNIELNNAAVQYDKNPDSTINKESINLGGGTAGTTITNVKSGAINATSTDAINGSQLHNLGSSVASIIGSDATYDANGNLTANNIGGTGKGNISDAIAAVNQGNAQANESIKANTDSIKTNANNIKANNDSIKANTDDIKANTNRLNSGLSFGADSGNDINKSVGDSTALKFEGGNNITTTATGNGIKFDLNGNISVDSVTTGNTKIDTSGVTIKDGPSMTVDGIYAGDKTITGVADGIEVKDAVNFGQLNALDKRLGNSINELGYKIGEVEDGANAGISAAMAMSSLPQAYIPGKSMVGGGIATYNGQSAVAVGVSKVSDNGRWVIKANGTADTQGNAGGAIGAGFHF